MPGNQRLVRSGVGLFVIALLVASCSSTNPQTHGVTSSGRSQTPATLQIVGSNLIAKAAQITYGEPSAGVDLNFTETYNGQTMRSGLAGSFDFIHSLGSWSTQIAVPGSGTSPTTAGVGPQAPSSTNPPLVSVVETMMVDGQDYYVSIPPQMAQNAGNKKWLKLPISSYPQYSAQNPLGAVSSALVDPRVWAQFFSSVSGKIKSTGSATMNGSQVSIYQATANLTSAANGSGSLLPVLDELISTLQTALLPIQVTIDSSGRLVQAAVALNIPIPQGPPSGSSVQTTFPRLPIGNQTTTTVAPGQGTSSFAFDAVITFSTFGIPVSVSVPSGSETQTLG